MAMPVRTVWVSVRDVLNILFRHKRKIAAFFIVAVGAVTVFTYFIVDNAYRSEARLLVKLGRENLAVDPSVSGPTVSLMRDRESEMNSEVAIFTSRELAEELVDEFGVDAILRPGGEKKGLLRRILGFAKAPVRLAKSALVAIGFMEALTPHEEAVRTVMESLSVEAERRTNIINARYDAPLPDVAHAILTRMLQRYLDRHIEAFRAQASPKFFEEQSEQLRIVLADREKRLNDYQARYGIAELEQQKQVLLQQVSDSERQLADTSAEAGGSQAKVDALERSLAGFSKMREISRTTGRTNTAADQFKVRLADMRLKEADLAARYPDTHQPLVDLREQMREIEQALGGEEETRTEVTTGVDTNYQEIELSLQMERAQAKALVARRDALQTELAREREQLAALTTREVELNTLRRDVQLGETEYRQYRDNLQRSKISAAMDMDKVSNISVIQAATVPMNAAKPQKALNVGAGALLGIAGGLALALLFEYLDDTVRSRESVERRLGVPVLTEISEKEFSSCT